MTEYKAGINRGSEFMIDRMRAAKQAPNTPSGKKSRVSSISITVDAAEVLASPHLRSHLAINPPHCSHNSTQMFFACLLLPCLTANNPKGS